MMDADSDCRHWERAYAAFIQNVTHDLSMLKAMIKIQKYTKYVAGEEWHSRKKLRRLQCLFKKIYVEKIGTA